MGILRADRITGLGGANAIKGSVLFSEKQYFITDNHEDFQFGTGDWTIEYWWNGVQQSSGGYNSVITTLVTSNESGTWRVGHTFNGNNQIYFARGTGSGFTDVTFDVNVNDNKWHHIAFVRSSGTIIPFVDGVDRTADKTNGSVSDGNSMTTTNRVIIGFNSRDNDHINGHVSNLRVIKGTALYTSNFTPPTGELQKLSGTSLLCFQSPSNILKEETGKILQPYRDGSTAGDQAGLNSTYAVATRFTPNSPVGFSTTADVGSQYGTTFDGFGSFATSTYMFPPGGNTRERNRGRGLIGGGNTGSATNNISYVEIQSMGNAQDFGDLTNSPSGPGGVSSSTRGIFAAGAASPTPSGTDVIQFVTIANTANAIDFGNLLGAIRYTYGGSNETRGLYGGGNPGPTNVIQYITIATAGNSAGFGDLSAAKGETGATSSSVRCLWGGGTGATNVIEHVTIATLGNAVNFGDLTLGRLSLSSTGSTTRAVFGGGYISAPTFTNTIDYVTIASTGDAADFGDMTQVKFGLQATSNSLRGIFVGGQTPSFQKTIEHITIASTGNAADFGDLLTVTATPGALSDSHGGLS